MLMLKISGGELARAAFETAILAILSLLDCSRAIVRFDGKEIDRSRR